MLARYDAPDSDSGGSEDATDSSSCGSQSSSPSIKSTSKVISRMRSLDLNHVLCMDTAEDGDLSQAAANGKSRDRILLAMKNHVVEEDAKDISTSSSCWLFVWHFGL